MELKLPKRKKVFKKGGLYTSPDIFWDIIQVVAFLFILGSLVFGFFLFRKINKAFVVQSENSNTKTTIISKERIDKALEYYANKEKISQNIITLPSPIIDPSR
jgi:hypothetical protein